MKSKIQFIVMLFLFQIVWAQKPVEVEVTTRDGKIYNGSSTLSDINITTEFGKLAIPVKNITRIDLGISSDKSTNEKVANLIKQMSGTEEAVRKGAYEELIKIGIKAIPAINAFFEDPKNEFEGSTSYSPNDALEELKSSFNVTDVSDKDVFTVSSDFIVTGNYDFNKIEIKTEFGNLSIPREKISSISVTWMGDAMSGESTFKLNATKHISSNTDGGWLKTGIMIKKGQKVSVFANGEVTLASLSNQKYHPDGSYINTNGEKLNGKEEYDEYTSSSPSYGTLVYKIGDKGKLTAIGAKGNINAKESGQLYFSIYETVYNKENSGSYSIKIAK